MSISMTETRQADTSRASARDEERWQAVQSRDRSYDGSFVTAVLSTGIYCRPSCPARTPHRTTAPNSRRAAPMTPAE